MTARQPKDALDYPFQLTHGLAWLRLPRDLDPRDAKRLIAFINALVTEDDDA